MLSYALLSVHSSFAIILKRERKLVDLLLLSYRCIVTINVLWLFITEPWVGLQCVMLVFPDHSHLPFLVKTKTQLYTCAALAKDLAKPNNQHKQSVVRVRTHGYA